MLSKAPALGNQFLSFLKGLLKTDFTVFEKMILAVFLGETPQPILSYFRVYEYAISVNNISIFIWLRLARQYISIDSANTRRFNSCFRISTLPTFFNIPTITIFLSISTY